MIRPLLEVCGQSETWVVWMSADGDAGLLQGVDDRARPGGVAAERLSRRGAVRRHAEVERRPIRRRGDRAVAGDRDRRAGGRGGGTAEVRLCHAGDRGRDQHDAGDEEDRAESVHAACTARRDRTSQRSATTGRVGATPCGALSGLGRRDRASRPSPPCAGDHAACRGASARGTRSLASRRAWPRTDRPRCRRCGRDLAADEQAGKAREDAERSTRLPRRGGPLCVAVRKEVREPALCSRTGGEVHLLRDAPTIDLRRDVAVVRATEAGANENDVHGVSVGDPPPLHAQCARLRSPGHDRLVNRHRGRRRAAPAAADSADSNCDQHRR